MKVRRVHRMAAVLGWACAYCGITTRAELPPTHPERATVEHVVPKSAGGSSTGGNLVIACCHCNALAGRWVDPWLASLHRQYQEHEAAS